MENTEDLSEASLESLVIELAAAGWPMKFKLTMADIQAASMFALRHG